MTANEMIEKTQAMSRCAFLVRELDDVQSVGGALHIVTDDYNLEDEHLEYCRDIVARRDHWSFEQTAPENVEGLARLKTEILDLLSVMTLEERYQTMELARGREIRRGSDDAEA